ncbi:MAG: hypothetical protein SGPRY_000758 [Prymnesium sp.]
MGGALALTLGCVATALVSLEEPAARPPLPPLPRSPSPSLSPDPSFNYYAAVRLALLGAIVLLSANLCSVLYLRWAIGGEAEEARDGGTFIMCSFAQSVGWSQALLLAARLSGLLSLSALQASIWQYCSSLCLWVLTPFAYLYHEAVGICQLWGTTGIAARAVEAGVLLVLLTILVQGSLSVFNASTSEHGEVPTSAWSIFVNRIPLEPRTSLNRLASHVGLAAILLTTPRGALYPILSWWLPYDPPSPRVRPAAESLQAGFHMSVSARCPKQAAETVPSTATASEAAHHGNEPSFAVFRSIFRHYTAAFSTRRPTAGTNDSLLAQQLPTRWGKMLASARSLPVMLPWLLALASWILMMLMVAVHLLRLLRLAAPDILALTAAHPREEELVHDVADLDAAMSLEGMNAVPNTSTIQEMQAQPADAGDEEAWSWLAIHFVMVTLCGHHLVFQYDARGIGRRRHLPWTQMQMQLVQTAILQKGWPDLTQRSH